MAASITCPMCRQGVSLEETSALALLPDSGVSDHNHGMSVAELGRELQRHVDKAVWAAFRAIEDQAAYARWAAANGKTTPASASDARDAAELLRKVLSPQPP